MKYKRPNLVVPQRIQDVMLDSCFSTMYCVMKPPPSFNGGFQVSMTESWKMLSTFRNLGGSGTSKYSKCQSWSPPAVMTWFDRTEYGLEIIQNFRLKRKLQNKEKNSLEMEIQILKSIATTHRLRRSLWQQNRCPVRCPTATGRVHRPTDRHSGSSGWRDDRRPRPWTLRRSWSHCCLSATWPTVLDFQ